MPAQKPLHPSKLYAMLRECSDPRARAAAALDFLLQAAAAHAGYLLLAQNGELVLAASSNHEELPASLMERTRALWSSDHGPQGEGDDTRTMDAHQLGAALVESPYWDAPDGERYEPRVMGIYRDSRWVPVGVSVLAVGAQTGRRPRHAHIEAICNALLDSGDLGARPA